MSLNINKSTTVGAITGDDYMDQIAGLLERLFGYATIPLTSVGGTGDAITASMPAGETADPLTETAQYALICAAANTGAVTLNIAGGGAVPVLDASGAALTGGELSAGHIIELAYRGSDFLITSDLPGGVGAASPFDWQEFTASGTWSKPAGLSDDTPVRVRAWGAGAGGERDNITAGSGGGGGAFVEQVFRLGDLPSSVAVTIGAGGAGATSVGLGSAGGATSFGALLTAAGGAGNAGGSVQSGVVDAHWDGGAPGVSAIWGGAGGGGGSAGVSQFGGNGGAQ
ncbi:hypothetical protein DYI42_19425, partial [Vannielia litorea]|nr:hypothetical protein [Vannielia litorea]